MTNDSLLIEFLTRLQSCNDRESSWRLYTRAISDLGYTQNTYGYIADHESNCEIILSNYNAEFVASYMAIGGTHSDDTIEWAQTTGEVCHWLNPTHRSLDKKEYLPLEELSQDFNVCNGATIQLKTRYTRSSSYLGLSATDSSQREYERDVIRNFDLALSLSHILEMHLSQFEPYQMLDRATHSALQPLRPLEQETIRWLCHGLTISEIADKKMFKSVESINLYIKEAKQKLQVRNRDQLIARAVVLGLV
ncbi:MAG: LuxR C-terminal-related transcriptional regulator [Gammaproteobacteria bacterium]|nr:LuxR C-terminal-related transcriptional regulator [Gammaproteobacteria bacterium]